MAAPVLRWRAFLGGSPTGAIGHDADLDGDQDVLSIEGGAISARAWSGTVLWKSAPIGAKSISSVVDVNGDDIDDVVVRLSSGVQVLSGISGDVLWTSPTALYPKLYFVSVNDFDGDGVADIALADQGGALSTADGAVRIYKLTGKKGLLAATPKLLDEVKARGDTARVTDVDGDGLPDVLIPIHESSGKSRIYAFSGKTGKLLAKASDLKDANCHRATTLPQAEGSPLVICTATPDEIINANSTRGAWGMVRQGAKLVRLWTYLVPDVKADRFQAVFVGDMDGDDKAEVVASEHIGGTWRVHVLDAHSGKSLAVQAANATWLGGKHIKAHAVQQIGAKGAAVIRCSVGQSGPDGPQASARLVKWSRSAGFSAHANVGKGLVTPAVVQSSPPTTGLPGPGAAVAMTASVPAADYVLRLDSDGDGRIDAISIVRVDESGGVKEVAKRSFKLVPAVIATLAAKSGPKLLVVTGDGYVRVLDKGLKTVNDADSDGLADLTYGGSSNPALTAVRVKTSDKQPRILVGSGANLRVYDLAGAGPLTPPALKFSFGSGPAGTVGTLLDLDGDGARELVVRHRPVNGSATITAWTVSGAKMWSYTHPGVDLYWATRHGNVFAPVDLDKDGALELMLGYREPGTKLTDAGRITIVSGKTGKSLWAPGRPCSKLLGTNFSIDDSGKELTAIFSVYNKRHHCRLSDGVITAEISRPSPQYGVPMLTDLDGDGDLDVVLSEGFKSVGAERNPGHEPIWQTAGDFYFKPSALVPAGKQTLLATAVGPAPDLRVLDAKTGKQSWQRRYAGGKALASDAPATTLPTLRGLISVADLVGDGKPRLLFHTSDGWLYAVSALDGAITWSMNWGGVVGDPIVADIDGDGDVEVLLTSPDGYLNALDHDVLGSPDWLYENAGKGPATTAKQDIDEQEISDRIHLNWAAMDGVHGYAVQVADSDGGIIVPLRHVSASTSLTVEGVNLHLGRTYLSTVRGWIDGDKGKQYSRPTASDGVTIVDLSAPWIEELRATPPIVPHADGASDIMATLHDATRLARVKIVVTTSDGDVVATWQRALAVKDYDLNWTWSGLDGDGVPLPAGIYTATVTAKDGADHQVTDSVDIVRCGADEVIADGACTTPTIGPDAISAPDVGSEPSTEARVGSESDDCCSASPVSGGTAWPALLLLLTAASLLRIRRRFARGSAHQHHKWQE